MESKSLQDWYDQLPPGHWARRSRIPTRQSISFERLIEIESAQIAAARSGTARPGSAKDPTHLPGTADRSAPDQTDADSTAEPWVRFAAADRLGVALSGGGIRSATFNLGLLQSMAMLGLLRHVDYLATVSGGGYVGGFWTRWMVRQKAGKAGLPREHFPVGAGRGGDEPAEVRHLREFSRFLLPRMGIHRTDFWTLVMTLLGGLIPALGAALAVVILMWTVWLGVMHALLEVDPIGYRSMALVLLVFFASSEVKWRFTSAGGAKSSSLKAAIEAVRPQETVSYSLTSGLALMVAVVVWATRDQAVLGSEALAAPGEPAMLAPAIAVGLASLVLLALRPIVGRSVRGLGPAGVFVVGGYDRSLSRLLGFTAAAAAVSGLWSLAEWVLASSLRLQVTTGTATVGAALFAAVRRWLAESADDSRPTRLIEVVGRWFKRATPRVLATIVWLLVLVLVGAAMQQFVGHKFLSPEFWPELWVVIAAALITMGATMWWFDPARVGLHEFYRSRIARCYLGASLPAEPAAEELPRTERQRASANRGVTEDPHDDLTLGKLREAGVHPIHLVCTAANELSGDPVGSLYRGARSAVLSQNGITIGNESAQLDDLRYSAALTASAAAFNSQMGRLSMSLGPPVAFLMSALNLRLGLWVPHPRYRWRQNYTFPGRFFFRELFAQSRTDGKHVHLSDGGHFENIGLYELVRRHCRWIVVSDCGEDSSVVFDDLANVLRRIREDFGVEVDVDISPLRSAEGGFAQQHAVVGTIHYDGPVGTDKGVIVLVKPTLTGDEPADILNYKSRLDRFPHESTGDQFFDEAQWESYRRLGEHIGWSVLRSAETISIDHPHFSDRLFLNLRERLRPQARGVSETVGEIGPRFAELEADVFANGPEQLRYELFPELHATGHRPAKPKKEAAIDALSYVMRALRIMEDLWRASERDRVVSTPFTEGWVSYCQRWASTPTYRKWWPILRPLYADGFRDYARERFGVQVGRPRSGPESASVGNASLSLTVETDVDAFTGGHAWRQFVQRTPAPDLAGLTILRYRLQFGDGAGEPSDDVLDVGFALMRPDGRSPVMNAQHLYVPPALTGAGIVSRLLDDVIAHCRHSEFARLTVNFGLGLPGSHVTADDRKLREALEPRGREARDMRVTEIEFYRSRGFERIGQAESTLGHLQMRLDLNR